MVGLKQTRAYCRNLRISFQLDPSLTKFKFGGGAFRSIGRLPIRIPIPDGSFIVLDIEVVKEDTPMLIGIGLRDRERTVPNNVLNIMTQEDGGWTLHIVRKSGHMYLEWKANEILFTRPESIKLHRHFRHPTVGKLWELIKKAIPHQVDEKTRELLKEITEACETCKTFSAPPQRFTVSLLPSETFFNRQVAMDVMWIEGKAVLHVVDTETHFNAACYFKKQTVEGVWESFVTSWAALYIGYPEKFVLTKEDGWNSGANVWS